MLLGGSHFAQRGGNSKSLIELAHATVFMRTHLSEIDIGRYAEPGNGTCISGCDGARAFGINVAPILVRFTFP
jgi:hypothetical protein